MTGQRGTLLAIIEFGAYPNFAPLYQKLGYEVVIERSVRKALSTLRKLKPAVIVAEFNYQSDFRDRTSSLESVFSVVQTLPGRKTAPASPALPPSMAVGTKVVVFYDAGQAHQFERLRARFPVHAALTYPIDPAQLEAVLS